MHVQPPLRYFIVDYTPMHVRTSVAIKCMFVGGGGGGEDCANFILGVINSCENFERKAKVTNIEAC